MQHNSNATTGSFCFPWYYCSPPFFTLQPVLNTRKKQLDMWQDLILAFMRHFRQHELDINEAAATSPLFVNTTINRRLSPDAIRYILDDLAGKGNGEWQDKEKKRFTILWRTPAQWGSLIYKWVCENGFLDTVMTLYEIREGQDTVGQEFHQLESVILMKALKELEKQGKAKLFSGIQSVEVGVKFFAS